MTDFIIRYWIEVFFGLIVAGIGYFVRHHWKLFKKDMIRHNEENNDMLLSEISIKIDASQKKTEQSMEDLKNDVAEIKSQNEDTRNGVLEIFRPQFVARCQKLLEPEHVITADEWVSISEAHDLYNQLGGNHKGDTLFEAVSFKFKKQIKA